MRRIPKPKVTRSYKSIPASKQSKIYNLFLIFYICGKTASGRTRSNANILGGAVSVQVFAEDNPAHLIQSEQIQFLFFHLKKNINFYYLFRNFYCWVIIFLIRTV